MPRFAANLGFLFPEHDFLDRFAQARRAGFRAVEFAAPYAYPPDELAMRLIDNGLECILVIAERENGRGQRSFSRLIRVPFDTEDDRAGDRNRSRT